ncbi:unnamed protein product, partial [Amoebophrya sp. A25]|eukprot:GSA25T00010588001.1
MQELQLKQLDSKKGAGEKINKGLGKSPVKEIVDEAVASKAKIEKHQQVAVAKKPERYDRTYYLEYLGDGTYCTGDGEYRDESSFTDAKAAFAFLDTKIVDEYDYD